MKCLGLGMTNKRYGLDIPSNPSAKEQRLFWRECMEKGQVPDIAILEEHRANRDNPYWRSTAMMEIMCEYILYLEDKCEKLRNNK